MAGQHEDNEKLDGMVTQWLADDLGPAETAELEAALLDSPAARARFWETATFDALLHEAVGLAGPTRASAVAWGGANGGFGQVARMAAASVLVLAIGGGLGAMLATRARAALARMVPRCSLVDESFESGAPPAAKYIPTEPNVWSGDATAVVGAKGDVEPLVGARMLELVGPHSMHRDGAAEFAAELWRVIPAAAVREAALKAARGAGLTGGDMRVELDVAFNQRGAAAGSSAGTRGPERGKIAGVGVYAFRGPVTDVQDLWVARVAKALASSHTEALLDELPDAWQRLQVPLAVPPEADFLLVHCYVRDCERRPGAVFDGQFMDAIRVSAWIEPELDGGEL